MTPTYGQTWSRIGGGTYRILATGLDGRLSVLNLDTGCREWVDAAEFQVKHRPVKPVFITTEVADATP